MAWVGELEGTVDFVNGFVEDYNDPLGRKGAWEGNVNIKDHKARAQWAEVVIGVETKLWSIVRLGYNVRYRLRLSQSGNEWGDPWYVPGFGKTGTTAFGALFNISLDI